MFFITLPVVISVYLDPDEHRLSGLSAEGWQAVGERLIVGPCAICVPFFPAQPVSFLNLE
jgi:hypothetical protein